MATGDGTEESLVSVLMSCTVLPALVLKNLYLGSQTHASSATVGYAPMRCSVQAYCTVLQAAFVFQLSSTEKAYAAYAAQGTVLCGCYAMPGIDLAHAAPTRHLKRSVSLQSRTLQASPLCSYARCLGSAPHVKVWYCHTLRCGIETRAAGWSCLLLLTCGHGGFRTRIWRICAVRFKIRTRKICLRLSVYASPSLSCYATAMRCPVLTWYIIRRGDAASAIMLRVCYAMSGTDIGYASCYAFAMQYPVLISAVLLPDVRTHATVHSLPPYQVSRPTAPMSGILIAIFMYLLRDVRYSHSNSCFLVRPLRIVL
eukprot:3357984-Rhodomonas_salina.3